MSRPIVWAMRRASVTRHIVVQGEHHTGIAQETYEVHHRIGVAHHARTFSAKVRYFHYWRKYLGVFFIGNEKSGFDEAVLPHASFKKTGKLLAVSLFIRNFAAFF